MHELRVLDLYCGAGGCSMGYARAGFHVTGLDHSPQPNYPFDFVLGDALNPPFKLTDFDLLHASPPCQRYSQATRNDRKENHPDHVDIIRDIFIASGVPYVIENVPGAPLTNPLTLCGTMFGLNVRRHRLFQTLPEIYFPPAPCNHYKKTVRQGFAPSEDEFHCVVGNFSGIPQAREAMDVPWMGPRREIAQAIPPAYTQWIGEQIKEMLGW